MNFKEATSLRAGQKVRYSIVGLGNISQEAMLPGVDHTGNSTISALVTGDATKAAVLSEKYKVARTYSYDEFEAMLASEEVDAIYLATPNWRHAEFAVPALQAGIHVLLEKPMEVSSELCEKIMRAQQVSGAKLMIAYRLHFEPATIAAIQKVRSGELGEVHLFTSTFCLMLDPENHRAHHGVQAGPIFDLGPYPINGARNVFESEPIEAFAFGVKHNGAGLAYCDDTVSVILRFPQNTVAQFTVSYFGNSIDTYTIVGTKGAIEVNPGYVYGKSLEHYMRAGSERKHEVFKNIDHFGGELKYFSDCIVNNVDPEPDGNEGLADLFTIEAIVRSLQSGKFEPVQQVKKTYRINPKQEQNLGAIKSPEMVNASAPVRGVDKNAKN